MNKETLQNYNERLNTNNVSIEDILEAANNLPKISGTIEITENGTVDVTNYKNANVNVYTPSKLQDKEVTPTKETQNVTADDDYGGLNSVTVKPIPDNYIVPSGSFVLGSNGLWDVTNYKQADVRVYPTLQYKDVNITSNGTQTITYDSGYQGLGSVNLTVNVEGGTGGGTKHPRLYGGEKELNVGYGTRMSYPKTTKYQGDKPTILLIFGFVRCENYTITLNDSSDGITTLVEKWSNDYEGINQKLFVAYYKWDTPPTSDYTLIVTPEDESQRCALGSIMLTDCDIPININDVNGTINTPIEFTADDKLNIYILSQVYGATLEVANMNEWQIYERLAYFISYEEGAKKITPWNYGNYNNSFNAIAHIQLPYKKS